MPERVQVSLVIDLGALSDPISDQIRRSGLPVPEHCGHLDKDADAIARLLVRGLLTETETSNARKRLMREVRAEMRRAQSSP